MSYIYETHCHCSQCSRCAHSTSTELVRAYHAAGYAGLVLTDHFVLGNTAIDRSLPWEEQIRGYYNAFLEAKALGDELDFDVIFGIEHACPGGEFLCYGIDLPFLLAHPEIPELSLDEFTALAHDHGILVIQAHPYRWLPGGSPLRLDILDGIEVFNSGNSPEANEAAAQVPGSMIRTAGGDIHRSDDPRIGRAGISLPYRVRNARELALALRQQDHRLLISNK